MLVSGPVLVAESGADFDPGRAAGRGAVARPVQSRARQITAAQGIQVAQAAATLAGGGPGVLDRLRGRLGLDRLVFGSAPSGMGRAAT